MASTNAFTQPFEFSLFEAIWRGQDLEWFDPSGVSYNIQMPLYMALHTSINPAVQTEPGTKITSLNTQAEIAACELFGSAGPGNGAGTATDPTDFLDGIGRIPCPQLFVSPTSPAVSSPTEIRNSVRAVWTPRVDIDMTNKCWNVVYWNHPHRGQGQPVWFSDIPNGLENIANRDMEARVGDHINYIE